MKVKIIAISAGLGLLLTLGACKKKEEPQAPVTPPAPVTQMPHNVMTPRGETQIVVPDIVKGKWKAVKIEILDKTTNKAQEVTIALNSEYTIPNSNLKIKVGEFLPDFKMDGMTITSVSNNPNNPAVQIFVFDGDKQIFKGWLYAKFPTIHSFKHEKYGLKLIEGIKAG